MRWPWSRDVSTASPGTSAPGTATAAAPSEPAHGWALLPPLQRVLPEPSFVTAPASFAQSLTAWSDPSMTGSMTHVVSTLAPSGIVDGDGLGTFGTVEAPGAPRREGPDLVLRSSAPSVSDHHGALRSATSDVGHDSLTTAARPTDLPVRSLAAVPDVAPDIAPDMAPDIAPDMAPDIAPEMQPDAPPETAVDAPPDAERDLQVPAQAAPRMMQRTSLLPDAVPRPRDAARRGLGVPLPSLPSTVVDGPAAVPSAASTPWPDTGSGPGAATEVAIPVARAVPPAPAVQRVAAEDGSHHEAAGPTPTSNPTVHPQPRADAPPALGAGVDLAEVSEPDAPLIARVQAVGPDTTATPAVPGPAQPGGTPNVTLSPSKAGTGAVDAEGLSPAAVARASTVGRGDPPLPGPVVSRSSTTVTATPRTQIPAPSDIPVASPVDRASQAPAAAAPDDAADLVPPTAPGVGGPHSVSGPGTTELPSAVPNVQRWSPSALPVAGQEAGSRVAVAEAAAPARALPTAVSRHAITPSSAVVSTPPIGRAGHTDPTSDATDDRMPLQRSVVESTVAEPVPDVVGSAVQRQPFEPDPGGHPTVTAWDLAVERPTVGRSTMPTSSSAAVKPARATSTDVVVARTPDDHAITTLSDPAVRAEPAVIAPTRPGVETLSVTAMTVVTSVPSPGTERTSSPSPSGGTANPTRSMPGSAMPMPMPMPMPMQRSPLPPSTDEAAAPVVGRVDTTSATTQVVEPVVAAGAATDAAPPTHAPSDATRPPGPTQGAMTPDQLDILARQLLPSLSRRLRTEMLLDRERRGLRTDMR